LDLFEGIKEWFGVSTTACAPSYPFSPAGSLLD
jgi:hypothetical protein